MGVKYGGRLGGQKGVLWVGFWKICVTGVFWRVFAGAGEWV